MQFFSAERDWTLNCFFIFLFMLSTAVEIRRYIELIKKKIEDISQKKEGF